MRRALAVSNLLPAFTPEHLFRCSLLARADMTCLNGEEQSAVQILAQVSALCAASSTDTGKGPNCYLSVRPALIAISPVCTCVIMQQGRSLQCFQHSA